MAEGRVRPIRGPAASAAQAPPVRRTPAPEGARTAQPRGLGAAPVDAARAPDTTYARIRVARHHTGAGAAEAFGVEAWCDGVDHFPYTTGSGQLRPRDIGLGHARRSGTPPSELFRSIRRWSKYQHQLTSWINRCRLAHGDGLQIVVLDQTGFDLPWEALDLPAVPEAGLRGGPLGALVDVARWLDDFPDRAVAPNGAVLGFFHPDMSRDQEFFEQYEHRTHFGIESFLNNLDDVTEQRTGLVYMGCHGTFDHELSKLTLAGGTWADYDDLDMRLLSRDDTLVCLNACHSGRFLDYGGDGRQYLRGFTQIFLRNGAGGCIVSAGEVGDSEARVMIRRIVDTVTEDPDRPVAGALRAIRAGVHDTFLIGGGVPMMVRDDGTFDTRRQRNVLRLLYSLMFQYYGHPLSTLRLTGRHQGTPAPREGGGL
ncbi:CHAT domain-containing protein [Streptomyces castrisilvae]|uniref:CHAT domain-containing protein n=1 Tax=Streptomyces castrisilvae TaxID=3033811 RepID=A0ABY9HNW7_9ACTN|nr:CHAT domain-containing protein [Streptomyces sp. Mut1]WLQ36247.1 CHAT domain-containing protein [Streptomyces sp. Mut1]